MRNMRKLNTRFDADHLESIADDLSSEYGVGRSQVLRAALVLGLRELERHAQENEGEITDYVLINEHAQ